MKGNQVRGVITLGSQNSAADHARIVPSASMFKSAQILTLAMRFCWSDCVTLLQSNRGTNVAGPAVSTRWSKAQADHRLD